MQTPSLGQSTLCKVDIANGFYRVSQCPEDIPKMGVIIPSVNKHELLIAFPLVLPILKFSAVLLCTHGDGGGRDQQVHPASPMATPTSSGPSDLIGEDKGSSKANKIKSSQGGNSLRSTALHVPSTRPAGPHAYYLTHSAVPLYMCHQHDQLDRMLTITNQSESSTRTSITPLVWLKAEHVHETEYDVCFSICWTKYYDPRTQKIAMHVKNLS
jgi:hypothetical protein